ncbi:MAG: class I SAM-dependent methyltransferase [Acidobacteria bacterium]|nr:class I SAM-dependent methyltransferase [Acidobacteriota bacterium]
MRRFHLIEIHEQAWCPAVIRDCATDYLQHVIHAANAYEPIAERLTNARARTGATCIVDLCSGGGGPWSRLEPALAACCPELEIYLTDLHRNLTASQRHASDRIKSYAESVNALRVPPELTGFRTLFTSFHHFKPDEARAILRDAVASRSGIGIFEGTQRRPREVLGMLLTPLIVWLLTPFIRPFRWTRLLWTYLLPVVPLVVVFDGVVSVLRSYTVAELTVFTAELRAAVMNGKWARQRRKACVRR